MADKTEKKPGFVARMKAAVKGFAANAAKFFRDTKSELKKVVTAPTRSCSMIMCLPAMPTH